MYYSSASELGSNDTKSDTVPYRYGIHLVEDTIHVVCHSRAVIELSNILKTVWKMGKSSVIGMWKKSLKSSYLDVVECPEHESDSHFFRKHVPELLEHLKVRKMDIFDRVYWAYMKSYTKIK